MTGLALRRVALPPLPRWRLAVAVLILGVALAGAAMLHWDPFVSSCAPPDSLVLCTTRKAGWVDPVALALCLLGVVAAVGVLMTPPRSRLR